MPLPAVIHCTSPGADGALVSHAVAVLHRSGEHVGDGLDAAVRMPGKARQIILGNIVAEIIEQQEGIEIGGVAESESAAQMHAGAFERRLGLNESLHGSNGHWLPQSRVYPLFMPPPTARASDGLMSGVGLFVASRRKGGCGGRRLAIYSSAPPVSR